MTPQHKNKSDFGCQTNGIYLKSKITIVHACNTYIHTYRQTDKTHLLINFKFNINCTPFCMERDVALWFSIHLWCVGSLDWSFMVDPSSYFLFQPVLHNCNNKGSGMCYSVCGMLHIKYPNWKKSSPCSGSSGFPLLLFIWVVLYHMSDTT